jgi:hypothetical protein
MNETNIRQLMERFLNAETTLEEEQTLYEYFQGEDVADDLMPYREAFQGFSAVSGIDKPEQKTHTPVWVIALRTVTSMAAIFLVGLFFYIDKETPLTAHLSPPSGGSQRGAFPELCEGSTPRELYMCYLERKREQPSTYSLIKKRIYESQH